MKRLLVITAALLTIALPALANHAEDLTLDCEGWSANFIEFNHTDHELLVTVNGLEVFYAANPPDGDFTLSGPLPEGLDGSVTLATFWRHLQVKLDGPALTVELDCTPDETTPTTTPNATTTVQVQETTTTTAAPCAEGLVHQPPLCVPPTTPEPTVPDPTTTAPTVTQPVETLPFTGESSSLLALLSSLFLTLGLVISMFVRKELT